jgi:hypothetical protein
VECKEAGQRSYNSKKARFSAIPAPNQPSDLPKSGARADARKSNADTGKYVIARNGSEAMSMLPMATRPPDSAFCCAIAASEYCANTMTSNTPANVEAATVPPYTVAFESDES